MIKLVVALGNPGIEYELTRHNIGWLLLDQLSFFEKLNWKEKFKGLYAEIEVQGQKIYFLKPQTFMNLSGQSVQALCSFFKIQHTEIIVIHDELDLPYGQIMFKKGGGLAGHNGLKSIAASMATQDFMRLRVGIDRPKHGNVSGHVLSKFSKDEFDFLGNYLSEGAKALEYALINGFEKSATIYSKKKLI